MPDEQIKEDLPETDRLMKFEAECQFYLDRVQRFDKSIDGIVFFDGALYPIFERREIKTLQVDISFYDPIKPHVLNLDPEYTEYLRLKQKFEA